MQTTTTTRTSRYRQTRFARMARRLTKRLGQPYQNIYKGTASHGLLELDLNVEPMAATPLVVPTPESRAFEACFAG